ncbi:triose-phosphate transporter family-domain-containing protein [Cercophora samala]|uniref:Triose-phosphate transporter family-domain-containing protein n=1 Tax=Cercophora samala TaxID=330535 RepID=A0AA39ZLT0_9PEZI|nr:triose-phosphate transporter family-domain-containing protein [Cercophora samala]
MPHSTSHMRAPSQNRLSSNANGSPAHNGTEKFPEFDAAHVFDSSAPNGGRQQQNGYGYSKEGATQPEQRWHSHARRDSRVKWAPGAASSHSYGHARKRSSISNAIHRMRSGSMSQNAHEIADALRAPVSWKLISLCIMWYWSSALTNTSSKSILTAFDKPATLTIVQFGFVSSYCLILSGLASKFPKLRTLIPALKHPIRYPSRDVIRTTLPLAAFQIGGHLLSSTATSKIPVSLVHTIKGLSPLFTVLAYRFIFDIRYPRATYISLIPLTIGVMLACSSNKSQFGGQFLGILYALFATIIFVTQNIFSKRLFNEAARAEAEGLGVQSKKLDKLNLLCYSSGMAFICTLPIWFWSEGFHILTDFLYDGSVDLTVSPNSFDHGRLTMEYIFNGTFHFGQNILAFVLLSTVSPVTYSVASLLKRVFVIFITLIWFRNPTTRVQAVGIGLTFLGLWMYDRSSERNKADAKARRLTGDLKELEGGILPLSVKHNGGGGGGGGVGITASPQEMNGNRVLGRGGYGYNGYGGGGYGYANGRNSPNAMMVGGAPQQQQQQQRPASSGVVVVVKGDTKKSDDYVVGGKGRNRGQSNAAAWLAPGTRAEETWRAGDGGQGGGGGGSLVAAR